MKIGVLMGGTSSEKAVSLDTGKAVIQALERLNHQATPLEYGEGNLLQYEEQLQSFDLVFIGYHGTLGEDGNVQSILETLGVPFTGSGALASALGMDKFLSRHIFSHSGIKVAPGMALFNAGNYNTDVIDQRIIETTGYPVVVKPRAEGSTVGITIVKQNPGLKEGVSEALRHGNDVLIEKYIPGRELTVGILEDKALPVVEIIASHGIYDYVCKYTKGKTEYICPAVIEDSLKDKIQDVAITAFNLLGCSNYGRVDFRFDGNECYCLEVNTLPGMTELSLVPMAAKTAGIDFDQLINKIVRY